MQTHSYFIKGENNTDILKICHINIRTLPWKLRTRHDSLFTIHIMIPQHLTPSTFKQPCILWILFLVEQMNKTFTPVLTMCFRKTRLIAWRVRSYSASRKKFNCRLWWQGTCGTSYKNMSVTGRLEEIDLRDGHFDAEDDASRVMQRLLHSTLEPGS